MDVIRGMLRRVQQKAHEALSIYQHYLDQINPHPTYRWIATIVVALGFCLRVYYSDGFYPIAYLLGLYILYLLVGFLSPLVNPESAGPSLPTRASDEFKPFIRRLPEFKFWFSMTMAFCIAFVITFFSVFYLPTYWPLLLCAWLYFSVFIIGQVIASMIKYKYIPFSFGKQKYGEPSSSGSRPE